MTFSVFADWETLGFSGDWLSWGCNQLGQVAQALEIDAYIHKIIMKVTVSCAVRSQENYNYYSIVLLRFELLEF